MDGYSFWCRDITQRVENWEKAIDALSSMWDKSYQAMGKRIEKLEETVALLGCKLDDLKAPLSPVEAMRLAQQRYNDELSKLMPPSVYSSASEKPTDLTNEDNADGFCRTAEQIKDAIEKGNKKMAEAIFGACKDSLQVKEMLQAQASMCSETVDHIVNRKDDGWIEWHGTGMAYIPLCFGALVEVKFKDGITKIGKVEDFAWVHVWGDDRKNIIAYRIVEEPTISEKETVAENATVHRCDKHNVQLSSEYHACALCHPGLQHYLDYKKRMQEEPSAKESLAIDDYTDAQKAEIIAWDEAVEKAKSYCSPMPDTFEFETGLAKAPEGYDGNIGSIAAQFAAATDDWLKRFLVSRQGCLAVAARHETATELLKKAEEGHAALASALTENLKKEKKYLADSLMLAVKDFLTTDERKELEDLRRYKAETENASKSLCEALTLAMARMYNMEGQKIRVEKKFEESKAEQQQFWSENNKLFTDLILFFARLLNGAGGGGKSHEDIERQRQKEQEGVRKAAQALLDRCKAAIVAIPEGN